MAMFDVRALFAAFRRGVGPRSAFERGVEAFAAGRHEAALDEFAGAVQEARSAGDAQAEAAALSKRGVALTALGRRAEALEAFATALERDERCAPALVNFGNLLLEEGHVLDAIDYYDAAIRADEAYPASYRNLGVAYKRLGRRAEAVRALRSAARLEGRRPPGRA